jgi:hypothetical protein
MAFILKLLLLILIFGAVAALTGYLYGKTAGIVVFLLLAVSGYRRVVRPTPAKETR